MNATWCRICCIKKCSCFFLLIVLCRINSCMEWLLNQRSTMHSIASRLWTMQQWCQGVYYCVVSEQYMPYMFLIANAPSQWGCNEKDYVGRIPPSPMLLHQLRVLFTISCVVKPISQTLTLHNDSFSSMIVIIMLHIMQKLVSWRFKHVGTCL